MCGASLVVSTIHRDHGDIVLIRSSDLGVSVGARGDICGLNSRLPAGGIVKRQSAQGESVTWHLTWRRRLAAIAVLALAGGALIATSPAHFESSLEASHTGSTRRAAPFVSNAEAKTAGRTRGPQRLFTAP
jgi:hypothetical protein